MRFNRLLFSILYIILLAAAASALTLDELLAGYNWNVDNNNIVNSVSYNNQDTDLNTKFDKIIFNVSVTANDNLKYIGFLGESSYEGTKPVSGTDSLYFDFYSSDFDEGNHSFSFKIFDSSNILIVDSYDNITYYFDPLLHETPNTIPAFDSFASEDIDADQSYEFLNCNFTFSTNKSGNYNTILYLKDNQTTITAEKNITLTEGISKHIIPFTSKDIRRARFDGNIILDSIEITGNDFNKKFSINTSTVIDYADFDPETSIITGSFIDTGIDLNSNTAYDILQLDMIIEFNRSSTFSIIGSVDDTYGKHILDFNHTKMYPAGTVPVSIQLNGTEFWETKASGPYKISYLKLEEQGQTHDLFIDPYIILNTSYYSDFEALPMPDLTVKFKEITDLGNGYSNVKVEVENIGQMFALAGYVELYNNRTDFLGSSSSYFIMPGASNIINFPRVLTNNSDSLTAFVDMHDLVEESDETNNMNKANTNMDISMFYNATSGDAPLDVSFSSTVQKGNSPFTFRWDFDDNTESTSQNQVKTFSEGTYTVDLTVKDSLGIKRAASVNITATPTVIDTTPPDSVTSLTAYGLGETWIYWTWADPSDSDFSHSIIYLNDSNIINTSNKYINTTGLSEETLYELKIETVDTNGNINTSLVSAQAETQSSADVSIAGLKLNKYWLYGAKNSDIEFNAGWYYPDSEITSVLWDFGDTTTSPTAVTSHNYAAEGTYTVQLTINSNIKENITVIVTENPSYNYESQYGYFTKKGSGYEMMASVFGNDAINGFKTDNDIVRIYAVVKIDGDSNITTDQVDADYYTSRECWPLGGDYFKCFVHEKTTDDAAEINWSYDFRIRDDSAGTVATMEMFEITESSAPEIILTTQEQYKQEGSFDFSYSLFDIAFPGMEGSGIGKLEIYEGTSILQSKKIDSKSHSGNYVYTPVAVAEGEEKRFNISFTAYDKTRLSTTESSFVVLDKKVPVFSSLDILENIDNIPREGMDVTFKANISDISDITAYANFSSINIDGAAGYDNKEADNCIKEGNEWICTWNVVKIKIAQGGDFDIPISYIDHVGNSGKSSSVKRIGLVNNDPVLDVSDITVTEGELITIAPSVIDPDGDSAVITYSGWMDTSTYHTGFQDAGTYSVVVTAADNFGGSDTETIQVTVNNAPAPDLVISSLEARPANPAVNMPIMVRFIIKNTGELAAQDINWIMEDSHATVSQQQNTFDLAAGEEMEVYALIKYSAAGTYNPVIRIDSLDTIQEIDERNNEQSFTVTIS